MAYVEANDFHLPMNWAEFQKWYEANHKKSRWRSSELDMLFDLKWGGTDVGLTNGVKMLTVRDQDPMPRKRHERNNQSARFGAFSFTTEI